MRRWPIRLAIVSVFAALWSSPAVAQAADPHAALPERPSVATHAHTVAPGWAEVEFGFERADIDDPFGDQALPLALKLGLKPRVQLTVTTAVARPAGEDTSPSALSASRSSGGSRNVCLSPVTSPSCPV